MQIAIHAISRQDPRTPDRFHWPENAALVLPRVGDQFHHSVFGPREVVSVTYVYGTEQGRPDVASVNIHLGLE